jgi:hypothetical protein
MRSFIVLRCSLKDKGKIKVVPVLLFNRTPRHDGVLGEWRYSSTHSLTSALDKGEWPWPLYPQGKSPWCPFDRGLGGSQRGKIPSPRRESNPRISIIQPVA